MSFYPSYEYDEDFYSAPEENSPWVLEKEIGKGGFGLVKLYINKVFYIELILCKQDTIDLGWLPIKRVLLGGRWKANKF